MIHRDRFVRTLTTITLLALASGAFAANTTYTQTAETYPAPDDCPPMCGPMTCIICTNSTTAPAQQIAFEVSLLVPDTTPATDYGIIARDGVGSPIILADLSELRFDACQTCPGPGAESPAPPGFVWINFKSQTMPIGNGSMQFVPHPIGPPGTPLPAMVWVSDTGDDDFGNTVTNLLTAFPGGTVDDESADWGEMKRVYGDE